MGPRERRRFRPQFQSIEAEIKRHLWKHFGSLLWP